MTTTQSGFYQPAIAEEIALINTHLAEQGIPKSSWFRYETAQIISHYLFSGRSMSNSVLLALHSKEYHVRSAALHPSIAFLFQHYAFGSYLDEDLDMQQIYEVYQYMRHPPILYFLMYFDQKTLLKVLQSFNNFLNYRYLVYVQSLDWNFAALDSEQLRLLSLICNRILSINLETRYKTVDQYLQKALIPAKHLLLREQQPPRVPYFASCKKSYASYYYSRHFEEQALQPPEHHEQFDKLCEIVKKNNSSDLNVFEYFGLASLGELQVMLRQEPFRHIDSKNMVVNITRERILIDYISFIVAVSGSLQDAGTAARQDFRVKFEGEKGADGGGLKNEFIYIGVQEIFKQEYCMFKAYENGTVWADNFTVLNDEDIERQFTYFGLFLGVALLNGICIGDRLTKLFYKLLLSNQNDIYEDVQVNDFVDLFKVTYSDVAELDEQLVSSLLNLRKLKAQDVDISYLLIPFTVSQIELGYYYTKELVPGGANLLVSNDNLEQYIYLRLKFEVFHLKHAISCIQRGFAQVIPQFKCKHILPFYLYQILGGKPATDLTQLEQITKYSEPFNPNHHTIKMFWKVVHGLSQKQKENFLLFVFSSHRVPINGFARFTIECSGDYVYGYPVAHTCGNVLCIPYYYKEDILVNRLLFAIENYLGFGIV